MERSSSSSSSPKPRRRASTSGPPQQERPPLQRAKRVVDLGRQPAQRPPQRPTTKPAPPTGQGPQPQWRYARFNERGELQLRPPKWPQSETETAAQVIDAIGQRVPKDITPENIDQLHRACTAVDALLSLCHTFSLSADVCLQLLQDDTVWAVLGRTPAGVWEAFAQQAGGQVLVPMPLNDADRLAIAMVVGALLKLNASPAACALMGWCTPSTQRMVVQLLLDEKDNPLYELEDDQAVRLFSQLVDQMVSGPHQHRYIDSRHRMLSFQAHWLRRQFTGQAVNSDPQRLAQCHYCVGIGIDGDMVVQLEPGTPQQQLDALAAFMDDAVRDASNDFIVLNAFAAHFPTLSAAVRGLLDAAAAALPLGHAGPRRPHAPARIAAALAQLLEHALRMRAPAVALECLQCLAQLHQAHYTQASACLQDLGRQLPRPIRKSELQAILHGLKHHNPLDSDAGRMVLGHFVLQMCRGRSEPELAEELLVLGKATKSTALRGLALSIAARGGRLAETLRRVAGYRPKPEVWTALDPIVACACPGIASIDEALAFSNQLSTYFSEAYFGLEQADSVRSRNAVLRHLIQRHLELLRTAPKPWSSAARGLAQWTWAVDAALSLGSVDDMAQHFGMLDPGMPKAVKYQPCLAYLLRGPGAVSHGLWHLCSRTLQLMHGTAKTLPSASQMLSLFQRCSPELRQALMQGVDPGPIHDQEEAIDAQLRWKKLQGLAPSQQAPLLLGLSQLGVIAPGGLVPLLVGLIGEPRFPELLARLREHPDMEGLAPAVLQALPGQTLKLDDHGQLPPGLITLLQWTREQALQSRDASLRHEAVALVAGLIPCVEAQPAAWRPLGACLLLGPGFEQVQGQVKFLCRVAQGAPHSVIHLLAGWLAQQIRERPDPALSAESAAARARLLQAVSEALKKLTSELHKDERQALRAEFSWKRKPH